MAEVRPYRQDYSTRRKRIFPIVSLACLMAAAIVLSVWYFHSKGGDRDAYKGKVVRISGSIDDIGLVQSFRRGESIRYYSAASGFKDLVFHRLQGSDSIQIVARDVTAYLRKERTESPAHAERAAPRAEETSPGDSPPVDAAFGDEQLGEIPPGQAENEMGVEKSAAPAGEPLGRDGDEGLRYARKREEGLKEYDQVVGELAAKADRIDSLWDKYSGFCQGSIAVTVGNAYGREWFGIYTTINAADTPECRMIVQDMQALAAEIDAGMEAAWEKAHRAGVYPGQMRAVQQKYRMELDRWNK